MITRRSIFHGVIVTGVLAVFAASAQDAKNERPADASSRIVLPNCRIKFIDQVVLASERAGTLDFVESREGDAVEKGKAIAGLRDDVARAALAVAEHVATNDVEVRFAQKSSEVSKAEYQKAVETNRLQRGTIPDVEILRLKLAEEKSKLQAEQAAHEFKKAALSRDQAQAELRSYHIDAPFSGVVTRVYKFAGEAVQQGDPIIEVVSPDRMRIEGFADVNDVRSISQNQRVSVQLEIPGKTPTLSPETLEGRIIFVDVSVQPVGNKVRVWAEVTNRDGILRAGQRATMIIDRNDKPLRVDTAAGKS